LLPEVHRDSGQWIEVPVRGDCGEEDFHGDLPTVAGTVAATKVKH
jgi:hypothetical protein